MHRAARAFDGLRHRLGALAQAAAHGLAQRAEAVAEAIERSGRSVHIDLVCTLICTGR
ncbi:hypothetical protein MAHJHV29_49710 [Mycobacterium avium subsp. hominissuis]